MEFCHGHQPGLLTLCPCQGISAGQPLLEDIFVWHMCFESVHELLKKGNVKLFLETHWLLEFAIATWKLEDNKGISPFQYIRCTRIISLQLYVSFF